MELRIEVEKHHLEISSIDSEDEGKNNMKTEYSIEVGVKTKMDDVEKLFIANA